ncbi:MAG: thiamine-phosphate kinase [Halobacteria archaeon]
MKEWNVVRQLEKSLGVGDDCGIIEAGAQAFAVTTDMIHRKTDLPDGVSPKTAGWRAMAVSLSDIAAMGADPHSGVLAIGVPGFDDELLKMTDGAREVCMNSGANYVGGDLDQHDEATLVSTVFGTTEDPTYRSGSSRGELVCVTGELGRTCCALKLFEHGETERANELFRFEPRTEQGKQIGEVATSMMDISDGLAVSLHQLKEASGNGFEVESDRVPYVDGVDFEEAVYFGGDYELLFTVPTEMEEELNPKTGFTVIGECSGEEVSLDGRDLEKRGYQHG